MNHSVYNGKPIAHFQGIVVRLYYTVTVLRYTDMLTVSERSDVDPCND